MDEKSRLELVRMGMPEDMQVFIKMDAILDEARGHPGKYINDSGLLTAM
ncbi:hypothetical protein HF228_35825 [Rhizobium leguminosarum]|nr:hypothetical protein [Rhizobium leguminosarum]